MSELIQKETVTFEELCPKWSRSIQSGILSEGLNAQFRCCVVGEAYGFKAPYNCSECNVHATGLVNFEENSVAAINVGWRGINDGKFVFTKLNDELFEQRKEAFMKHWNDKHA